MKPIYRKYSKRAALIWAGCLVLFLVAYFLLLGPQNGSRKLVEQQLAEKRQIYETAQKAAQKETKARLNKQVEQLQSKLNDFVFDYEYSANLTFDISQMATDKQVGSFSIKGKDSRNEPTGAECQYISETYMTVGFVGTFNEFAAFLNTLERHRPVVFVDRFSIESPKKKDADPKVNMDLAVIVGKRADSGHDDDTKNTI
ncbi:MAG: GspMb/PilO family protein [Planctomycetota bacterium]|jgi:hypothetical protein